MADWMNVPYLQYRYGGVKPARAGLAHPTIAPYGAYICKDNIRVLIAIQNEREWQNFCENILNDISISSHPDFHDVTSRVKNRPALEAMISKFFISKDSSYIIEKLKEYKIAFGRMNDVESLLAHPQLRTTFMVQGDSGIEIISPAPRHAGQATAFKAAPAIGAHNDLIWSEFS
jgi:crotonobetainyl-CoA:carnitine CoA-transferase CaiB-like acyl-CoA transferase